MLKTYFESTEFWVSLIVLAAAVAVWFCIRFFSKKFLNRSAQRGAHSLQIRFAANALKVVFALLVVITILQINGINVGSLVAGLGVVSVIVGFALQDVLKDLMMGVGILWDRFFAVGDVVRYGTIEGEVIDFNIKVTKLRNIKSNGVLTICNRNISEIEKLSDWLDIRIPTSYDVSVQQARGACEDIRQRAKALPQVTDCEFLGTDEFADSSIYYRLRIHCAPENQAVIRRAVLGLIQDVFEKEHMTIPYPQMDVHIGK